MNIKKESLINNKVCFDTPSVVNILYLSDLHFGVDKADETEYEWISRTHLRRNRETKYLMRI